VVVTLTSRGRITLPKPVRDYLGLTAGSVIDFRLTPDGCLLLLPASEKAAMLDRHHSRFAALRGRAGSGLSTDEIMALTRG
jgi:AbrB family looped-hinge helix DNA binding protein